MLARVAVFLAVAALFADLQAAERGSRRALVIANSDYQNLRSLVSPVSESQLISDALMEAGFEVQRLKNLNREDFFAATVKFVNSVRPGDAVVFYFSGYAVQGDDDNFLLPVDFQPGSTLELQERAYRVRKMQQGLDEAAAGLKIFVLESARSIGVQVSGSVAAGLMAQPEVPRNVLFAFAASPGQTVPATNDDISPFTRAVAQSMRTPGRRLPDVFGIAKREVASAGVAQTPYLQDNILNEDFFFTYPAMTVTPPSLSFVSPQDVAPPSQTLSVFGGGYAGRFKASSLSDAKWLSLSKDSGTTPASGIPAANLEVSVSPRGLGPGRYDSRITISAPDSDMTSSPRMVNVSYTILPAAKPESVPRSNRRDREEYLLIPSGQFRMGCVPADKLCKEDERPQHPVTITKNFWIGRNEVQVDSYRRFAAARSHKMPAGPLWDSHWQKEDLPIVDVTWENARDYCEWAGGRLPTEAEWEYAARAGADDQIYPLNDENSRDKANFAGKRGNDIYNDPAPVRKFDPSSFGLYDMAGNVWEWVSDYFAADYYSHSPMVDPKGPAESKQHVMRGGSFDSDPQKHLRISIREAFGKSGNAVGFRCALNDTSETRNILNVP
jgi:sulfatase modifying factor 1